MNRKHTNKIIFVFIALALGVFLCSQVIAQYPEEKREANMQNPFGVLEFLHWNHSWNNYKYATKEDLDRVVKLMKEAGVGWVRMDFLWSDIEPQEGKFEFEKYDYIVDLLNKNSIRMLGILHYSTDWASSCGKWNCPPQNNTSFINYVTKVIGRYKDKIKHWEVWNEPDSSTYWQTQDELKSYCVLLKEVYLAAKKIDPTCKILNGGLANGISSVNHLYDNGGKGYFDILNLHIFDSPLNGGAINRVMAYPELAYKIMQRNGDGDKKIWITEIGCPGVKEGLEVKNWWMGKNPSEEQQAYWVRYVFHELLRNPRIENIFWAYFRDCKNHWDNGIDYFGLVRWDFSKKPSFDTYRQTFDNWIKGEAK